MNQLRRFSYPRCQLRKCHKISPMTALPYQTRLFSNNNGNNDFEMEYRMLGGTGLKVSTLSFGFWATYGVKEGVDRCVSVLRICRENGINFFDNAETYGKNVGDAEAIMGQSIKILEEEDPIAWRRSDIVLTTKLFWGGLGANERGLSRKHLVEGMRKSVNRLEVDYVDLIYCHRPDPLTSTEEVVRAMHSIIESGLALYWGTSEWSAQQITEAFYIAKMYGLHAPVVEQPQYNLFHRERFEKEYHRLYQAPINLGTTIWSPLASGVLTGKYNKEIPQDSRMATKGYEWMAKRWETEKAAKLPIVEKLMQYADKNFNTSVSCLAIAWCIKNKNVSTVLLGATKERQIEENLKSLEVAKQMTAQHMADIDEIVGNKPVPEWDAGRTVDNLTNPL